MMVVISRQDISVPIPKVITLDFTLNLRYFYNESLESKIFIQIVSSPSLKGEMDIQISHLKDLNNFPCCGVQGRLTTPKECYMMTMLINIFFLSFFTRKSSLHLSAQCVHIKVKIY